MKFISYAILYTFSLCSLASTVAVLDNGVDYTHSEISQNIHRNLLEVDNGIDDDGNGHIDDILGWNFIEMNNEVFDFSRNIYLTSDIARYYSLRAKNTLGTISKSEKEEYNILKKDKILSKQRSNFISWMHGTHVAGIAINTKNLPKEISEDDIKLVSITYLGSATFGPAMAPSFQRINITNIQQQKAHIEKYWDSFLKWQLNKFRLGVNYAASRASVVNGSFGQSFEGIQSRMKSYYKKQFGYQMSENTSFLKTKKFMQELIEESTKILKKHPDTLFVFSAGNKKNNSDKYIHFPSAIRSSNSLSIGASFGFKEMAYFSNYGLKTVDIFAPGMAIRSTIPRQGYLTTNGTSQAAPYISNISVKALALAKNLQVTLTIQNLKKIIMATALQKEELKFKSISKGIIYPERVFQVVRNLQKYSLNRSISLAKEQYLTKRISNKKANINGLLLELPSN